MTTKRRICIKRCVNNIKKYADKEDDDIHGIDDNMSIIEQEVQDDSFLDNGLVRIEDLEEFNDSDPLEDKTENPPY